MDWLFRMGMRLGRVVMRRLGLGRGALLGRGVGVLSRLLMLRLRSGIMSRRWVRKSLGILEGMQLKEWKKSPDYYGLVNQRDVGVILIIYQYVVSGSKQIMR